jgi:hypothetical protein
MEHNAPQNKPRNYNPNTPAQIEARITRLRKEVRKLEQIKELQAEEIFLRDRIKILSNGIRR